MIKNLFKKYVLNFDKSESGTKKTFFSHDSPYNFVNRVAKDNEH